MRKKSVIWLIIGSGIYWFVLQMLVAVWGTRLSTSFLMKCDFCFKSFAFEREGDFWNDVFQVKRWKDHLPKGHRLNPAIYNKSTLMAQPSAQDIYDFIIETRRAEFVHGIAMLPMFVFLAAPKYIKIPHMTYALLANVPCMIVQRYNRPKLERYYHKLKNR